jgi:hypothetical protein
LTTWVEERRKEETSKWSTPKFWKSWWTPKKNEKDKKIDLYLEQVEISMSVSISKILKFIIQFGILKSVDISRLY